MALTRLTLSTLNWAVGAGFVWLYFFAFPSFIAPRWSAIYAWLKFGTESDLLAYLAGTIIFPTATLVVGNIAYGILYLLEIPFIEGNFRVLKEPWPWTRTDKPHMIAHFWSTAGEAMAMTAFNLFALGPFLAYLAYALNTAEGRSPVDDASFPTPWTIIWQFCVFAIIDDVTFYIGHRAMHHPRLYWIHKPHHKWHHTVTLAVLHIHPLEYIISNVVPAAGGPILCHAHLFTVWMWYHVRLCQTLEAHSNYSFPFSPTSLLYINDAGLSHEAHHSINLGNFGSLTTIWDRLFGTHIPHHKMKRITGEQKLE